ncbi:MAG TPA: MBL fold metallo-hydrolase, partial [Dehalococcoidia bacterium]
MPKVHVLMDGYGLGTDQGIIGFCAVVLIEGEQRVLFDSAHVGRRSLLLARLAERGLTPADIDAQVLSHSHWDHVQNVDLFDHAPLLVHANERRYAHKPHQNDWATPKWTGAVLDTLKLQDVGEGYEIMPGCRVVELIGHSAGSIGLEVETDEGRCLVVGDALPNARAAVTGNISYIFWNEAQAIASAKRIATSGATIYPGHDRPFRLEDGEPRYQSDYR